MNRQQQRMHRRRASYAQHQRERRRQRARARQLITLAGVLMAALIPLLAGMITVPGQHEPTAVHRRVSGYMASDQNHSPCGSPRPAAALQQPVAYTLTDQARRAALLAPAGAQLRQGTVSEYTTAASADHAAHCTAGLMWPFNSSRRVSRPFDGPAQPWLAGHRGIDIPAVAGENIRAPARGVVSFAGRVAGKQVVSIRHGALTSSFEPASTLFAVGTTVPAGQPFAVVEATGSDHCDHACIHWGVRHGRDAYRDPEQELHSRRIALKPLDP